MRPVQIEKPAIILIKGQMLHDFNVVEFGEAIHLIEDPLEPTLIGENQLGAPPFCLNDIKRQISAIAPQMGDYTSLCVHAHGLIDSGIHRVALEMNKFMPTAALLAELGNAAAKPLHLTLYSCFGGAAACEGGALPEGSTFTTTGICNDSVLISLLYSQFRNAARAMQEGKTTLELSNPYMRFVLLMLTNPTLECSFCPIFPGVKPFIFSKVPKYSKKEINAHQLAEIVRFVEYCRTISPHLSATHQTYAKSIITSGIDNKDFSSLQWVNDLQDQCFDECVKYHFEHVYSPPKEGAALICSVQTVVNAFANSGVFPEGGTALIHAQKTNNPAFLVEYLQDNPDEVGTLIDYKNDKMLAELVAILPAIAAYKDNNGNPVLSLAINNRMTLFGLALIANKADVRQPNAAGIYPLTQAILSGQLFVALALRKAGAPQAGLPESQIFSIEYNMLRHLTGTGKADINALDHEGCSGLGRAVYANDAVMVRAFAAFDVNFQQCASHKDQLTALGLAMLILADPKMVQLLADLGADVSAPVREQTTPIYALFFWADTPVPEWNSIARVLLDKGADINARQYLQGNQNYTMLELAILFRPWVIGKLCAVGANTDGAVAFAIRHTKTDALKELAAAGVAITQHPTTRNPVHNLATATSLDQSLAHSDAARSQQSRATLISSLPSCPSCTPYVIAFAVIALACGASLCSNEISEHY